MKRAFGAGLPACTALLAFSALLLGTAVPALAGHPGRVLINDVSRLNPTHVSAVVQKKRSKACRPRSPRRASAI